MSTLFEKHVDNHAQAAREILRESLANGEGSPPIIIVIRGGLPVAHITPQMSVTDPGETLQLIATVAAAGFGADEIAVIMDSYVAHTPLNPLTGGEWGPGDMQRLAEHHNGVARGWVKDALSFSAVTRSGEMFMASMKYDITDDGPVFYPLEKDTQALGGRLTSVFTDAETDEDVKEMTEAGPLDDLMMARILGKLGCSVLVGIFDK